MSSREANKNQLSDLELVQSGGGVYYVLESAAGLLFTRSEQYGDHFLIWSCEEMAAMMCPRYQRSLPLKVSQITLRELVDQLDAFHKGGMRYIVIDKKPDGSGRLAPISDAIELCRQNISKMSALRPQMDEFVRLLEGKRSVGLSIPEDEQYLPIDCGNCGGFFTIHETVYLQWRRGTTPQMLCPHCMVLFNEGRWDTLRCISCGSLSGLMPRSLCQRLTQTSNQWRCQKCLKHDAPL